MEIIAVLIGNSLPMTILVFIAIYIGMWRRQEHRLPIKEFLILLFFLWIALTVIVFLSKIMLSGQSEVVQSQLGTLWGPLLTGIVIGGYIVDWRRKTYADK